MSRRRATPGQGAAGDGRQAAGMAYRFAPIGRIRSPYTDKFGIPRQPGLVTAAPSWLELDPPFAREEAFKGIEGFSHVWLVFVFHDHCRDGTGWRATVRPPRLGGRARVGVFASRAPYRPNPIGISAVEHQGLARTATGLRLRLRGVDLLDGTPVLDLKPYVPYADARPGARAGFAAPPPALDTWTLVFSPAAEAAIAAADPDGGRALRPLIEQVLAQDPRPGYMDRYPQRTGFALRLYDLEVRWQVQGRTALVTAVVPSAGGAPGDAQPSLKS